MPRLHLILSAFILPALALSISPGCNLQSDQHSTADDEHLELSTSEFRQAISGPGIVLAKFGAPWCGPCREVDVELDKLQTSNQSQLKIVRINVDDEPELADEYAVSAIPVILLFKDGKPVQQWLGYKDASEFQAGIDQLVTR